MTIIYRISENGYAKEKPSYVNNRNCLLNALQAFPLTENEWIIVADNPKESLNSLLDTVSNMYDRYVKEKLLRIDKVSVGHGAGTFNIALEYALELPEDMIVYFLENDYIHRKGSDKILKEGIKLGASFVSLYDHPDKYLDPSKGGNPYCGGGGENTAVYLSETVHWKLTNSTTMTFAATVNKLKIYENILRKHTQGTYPEDFKMFIELRENRATLISPMPSYSTHGETRWLSPHIDWENVINK